MNTVALSADGTATSRIAVDAPGVRPPARLSADRFDLGPGTDAPAPRKDRKRSFKRAALVALAVAGGIVVIQFSREWWTKGRFVQTTDDAYVGGDVTVIAPKVAGFISRLAVVDNQPVHAGDLLL